MSFNVAAWACVLRKPGPAVSEKLVCLSEQGRVEMRDGPPVQRL